MESVEINSVKDIRIEVINSKIANDFVKKHHYSGKVCNNSNLHFGAFLNGRLHGVMSFGPSLDKSKMIGLVKGTGWNNFLELNRMAFDDVLPRNSESRCISIALKLIRKNAPQIWWVISFADGTQCGDGTIYRASGFKLIKIKENSDLYKMTDGRVIHKMTLSSAPTQKRAELGGKSFYDITGGSYTTKKLLEETGWEIMKGYQLLYIYFLDKTKEKDLTLDYIPFTKIDETGAGMYKGEKVLRSDRHIN